MNDSEETYKNFTQQTFSAAKLNFYFFCVKLCDLLAEVLAYD